MDHVAIMNKKWKLIDKILSGEKTIESRWYVSRFAPWNRIKEGDTIYIKDCGMPVTATADVSKVLQFENLTEELIKEIYKKYWKPLGLTKTDSAISNKLTTGKNYCILIFLKNPQKIKSFNIDKTGYGNACAWICVPSINSIKVA